MHPTRELYHPAEPIAKQENMIPSREADLNHRPRDLCYELPTTVPRSTSWAIASGEVGQKAGKPDPLSCLALSVGVRYQPYLVYIMDL